MHLEGSTCRVRKASAVAAFKDPVPFAMRSFTLLSNDLHVLLTLSELHTEALAATCMPSPLAMAPWVIPSVFAAGVGLFSGGEAGCGAGQHSA